MIALKNFTGIIDGKEKKFKVGDKISSEDAKALNLKKKPDLAK